MKRTTTADNSLLIGDDAADLLTSYAALMARIPSGDAVTLRAIGPTERWSRRRSCSTAARC